MIPCPQYCAPVLSSVINMEGLEPCISRSVLCLPWSRRHRRMHRWPGFHPLHMPLHFLLWLSPVMFFTKKTWDDLGEQASKLISNDPKIWGWQEIAACTKAMAVEKEPVALLVAEHTWLRLSKTRKQYRNIKPSTNPTLLSWWFDSVICEWKCKDQGSLCCFPWPIWCLQNKFLRFWTPAYQISYLQKQDILSRRSS